MNKHTKENIKQWWRDKKKLCRCYDATCVALLVVLTVTSAVFGTLWYVGG